MSIKNRLIDLQIQIFEKTEVFIKFIAGFFGYPENKGMPLSEERIVSELQFIHSLPTHMTRFPPPAKPQTIWQMIIGNPPSLDLVERIIYESPKDGFYNFYIENYKNIYYLPDWLSEFIQIRLNQCLDITYLEMAREALFLALFVYLQMLHIRLASFWYLSINPYTRPLVYLVALTDWIEDSLEGFTPVAFGVDMMPTLVMGLTGKLADSLNHLVFTMPFLPTEGQRAKMVIDGSLRDIVVFRYLPSLWYKYPIPNDIREFWYIERPDILNYMEKHYKHLDIEFLPDRILNEIDQIRKLSSNLEINSNIVKNLSLQISSNNLFDSHDFSNFILHSQVYKFFLTQIDQLNV